MRVAYLIVLLVLVAFVTGCNEEENKRQTAEVTGNVMTDVYNPTSCISDSGCRVGQRCENRTCVQKNR